MAIAAASGFVLFTVVGFLVAPPIARHVAQKQLGELLGRKVTIGRLRINPLALSVTVGDFRIYEPDQTTPFLGFSRLYVNAEISSVFRRAPVIKEIALESLHIHLVRTKATADAWADVGAAYNFSDIVARLEAMPKSPEPPAPPDAPPPRFSLNNIHVSDLAIVFDDLPSGDHHEITDLAVGVPFVSTLPVYVDSFVEPGFSVRIDGTPFAIKGRTKPFKDSLETVLELRLNALDLTRYVPFVPVRLPFAVTSARLSLALDVAFVRPRADAPRLTLKGDVALEKLEVKEKHRSGPLPLCALEKLDVRVGETDLTAQNFHIENVLISGLDAHVRRQRDGSLNMEHLAPGAGEAAPRHRTAEIAESKPRAAPSPGPRGHKARPAEPPARFTVDAFKLEKAEIHFRDESVEPAFAADVRAIEVAAHGVSNAPHATARIAVGFRAVPGGTFHQEGTLRLAPLAASGKLTLEGIEPGRLAPYYNKLVAFDIGSGTVRLGASYEFEQTEARTTVRIADAALGLADLALRRRGARDDFFKLAALDVKGGKVDLGAHTVSVAEIVTRGGRVRAARDAQGVVDLTTLTPPAPATAAASPALQPARTDGPAPPDEHGPAWTVAVARFDLEKWGARFDDRAVSPAAVVTVDPIALHVTDLSTAPGAKLGLDLRLGINKTGRLQITGSSTLPPVTANVRFDLHGLELVPLQPYFQDQVNLTVTDGALSVKGQAALKLPASGPPQMNVKTDVDLTDLAIVDRDRQERLVGWKTFHVGALSVASPPTAVAIGDVGLSDLQARVVLSPDGRLNLEDAFAKPGAPTAPKRPPRPTKSSGARLTTTAARAPAAPPATAPTAAPDAPMPLTIGQVNLQGGQVTFTDQSVRPSYTAELSDLGGRISGLSSTGGSTAGVDIHGSINRSGTLTIAGKANPLAKDIALDVRVDVRDVELPPASPYTAKYAGYGISKGKLDIALAYKIAGRKLDATNKLVLDQFTFGDKVDSPDAVKLPVRLAVALLKDRRGVIDVDLPIAGSLDDPEFKVWGAILKVLGNLVVKAVTAPFSLLASAFGGGDELSRIDFAAGASILDAVAQKRLATLGKALRERPGISFEIEGGADPQRDREGLRRFLYERKLKAKKLSALVEAGGVAPSLDDIKIDQAERPSLIEAAYKAEKFPKPKNALGFEKGLPPDEMEKLMLANTRVENDELRALALGRATIVQAALAKSVPGGASRLYLVAPRLSGAGGHVEFKLKKD
ncbi:MAG TPA: DUF748 domain-containing protein [Polyangia bacterium]|nr:DUF748 domain-containing protein [Polyangia bacterium]